LARVGIHRSLLDHLLWTLTVVLKPNLVTLYITVVVICLVVQTTNWVENANTLTTFMGVRIRTGSVTVLIACTCTSTQTLILVVLAVISTDWHKEIGALITGITRVCRNNTLSKGLQFDIVTGELTKVGIGLVVLSTNWLRN
jgi:hypothetical protein